MFKKKSKIKVKSKTLKKNNNLKMNIGSLLVIELLSIVNKIKIYHWQTFKYSTHKALDFLFDELNNKIDELIETYIGKYDRFILPNNVTLKLNNLNNNPLQIIEEIQICNNNLLAIRDKHLSKSKDSDISNILDEIFGIFNKTIYLLTLT